MEEQASHILRRCCGLPLAISTIGGLLANRPKTSIEWRNLHEHLGAELESDPRNNITKVIVSSYDGLPYHLKSIFLYLSIFPENHEIRRTRLLRRWMAEGYIAKNCDMPAEVVGERFYNDLINRSMIEGSKSISGVRADRCRVHSMVLKIILSKFIEENQLLLIEKHSNEIPQSKIRHLVVSRWKGRDEELQRINLAYVRSLTIFGDYPASLVSPKLRLLRVLDLEDTINLKNDDLKHIGELRHLRYLCLRGTDVSKLPSSLQNLRYLETLDIQDTKVTQLPKGIAKLEKLCYLLAGVNFSKDLLQKMESGKERHKVGLLSCLCCNHGECCKVFNASVRAPEGIEKLQSLHVLGVVNVGNGNGVAGRLKKLTNLTNLRRLGVEGLTEKQGHDLCQSIGELRQLQRLEVRSDSLAFLNKMGELQVPKHLLSLRLCGNLSSLPDWIGSLNDLGKVKLLGTQLKHEDIARFQNLRNLTLLCLWEKSYIGDSLHFCTGTFPKLKFLDIDGLEKIEKVSIEKGAMPKLNKLWMNKCPKLQDNNSGLSGVPDLLNLNELLLKKCGEKENLTKILQRQISAHLNRPRFLTGKSIVPTSPSTPHTDS
jgi:Leucine-rich repeat (LRR) protein